MDALYLTYADQQAARQSSWTDRYKIQKYKDSNRQGKEVAMIDREDTFLVEK